MHYSDRISFPRFAFLLLLLLGGRFSAQANPYDSLLTDSQWYVPVQNLLAYTASGTNLADVNALSDQTTWNINTCINGVISGTAVANFQSGPITISSTTTMSGLITDSGQLRLNFTNSSNTTIGIGQVRQIDTTTYLEMQMITGSSTYLTHWAYMAPVPDDPSSVPVPTEWEWLPGTTWALEVPDLFGANPAQFAVDSYDNGYFWGSGTSSGDNFTFIASATPEGNLLFNILLGGTLTSLTGAISGDAGSGQMVMNSYDSPDGFSVSGAASVVPEPSSCALVAFAGLAVCLRRNWAARKRR